MRTSGRCDATSLYPRNPGPIGPGDGVAQASNASFDAAVFEIRGALLHGATPISIRTVFSMPTLEAMSGEIERMIHEDVATLSDVEVEQLAGSNLVAGA
jgi:hypothetical protein